MEEAGRYFFGKGPGRNRPGLDSPPDRKSLDCAKDGVGMHAAILRRTEDFAYGALYYHGRKIQLAQGFTRPHKGPSGTTTLSSNPAIE